MGCGSSSEKIDRQQQYSVDEPEKNVGNENTSDRGKTSCQITWMELSITAKDAQQAIIGHGSFGTVVRAVYTPVRSKSTVTSAKENNIDVAVKVLTKSKANELLDADFEKMCIQAITEIKLIQDAASKMVNSDCIVKAYGVVRGPLPAVFSNMFHVTPGEDSVGIVMRYEGGGSLEALLRRKSEARQKIPIADKIRLLKGIAKGLAELHSVGLVHADIKPENVLLSSDSPPEVRLADFGLAVMREPNESKSMGDSSLAETRHLRGTPIYCAPEMLVNPFADYIGTVAKPSRKTDMYAFAIVCWEVLAQLKPFSEIRSEGALCSRVHKGYRPSLDALPSDTPPSLIAMITACWDKDRLQRKSAVEVFSLLSFLQSVTSKAHFDILISHTRVFRPCLDHVIHFLSQFGYRVWYDQKNDNSPILTPDKVKSIKSLVNLSKVIVVCIDQSFNVNDICMYELRQARQASKSVIVLSMEENPLSWATEELIELAQLRANQYVDLGQMTALPWNKDEGPDVEMMSGLHKSLQPLVKLLNDAGCHHSSRESMAGSRNVLASRF